MSGQTVQASFLAATLLLSLGGEALAHKGNDFNWEAADLAAARLKTVFRDTVRDASHMGWLARAAYIGRMYRQYGNNAPAMYKSDPIVFTPHSIGGALYNDCADALDGALEKRDPDAFLEAARGCVGNLQKFSEDYQMPIKENGTNVLPYRLAGLKNE